MSDITYSCGFVRYPEPDGRFTVRKEYQSGQSGVLLCHQPGITVAWDDPAGSHKLAAFIEQERAPDGPDTWQILKALFPDAAARIEAIMLEIGRRTLLQMAAPQAEDV